MFFIARYSEGKPDDASRSTNTAGKSKNYVPRNFRIHDGLFE